MTRPDRQQEEEGRRFQARRVEEQLDEIERFRFAPREDDDED